MDKMEDFGIDNDFQYGDDVTTTTPVSPLQKILQNRKLLMIIVGVIIAIIVIIALIVLGILLITLLTGGSEDEETTQWRYGVIVDMGSSGSRVHVFEWSDTDPVQPAPHGGDKETGTYWFTEQKPGVSSYGSNPEGAGASLEPLLNYAVTQLNSVNANISATPIFLFATAGLRLLPGDESTAVLENIRKEIKDNYQFLFEDSWAATITGTQEATYDWLSIQQIILIEGYYNSTFSFFEYPEQSSSTTVGIIDLGGGSVEISFFPSTSAIGTNPDRDEFSTLTFDSEEYSIYGHSYLGYGHNSARLGLQGILVDQQSDHGTITTINDPCSVVGSVSYFVNPFDGVNYTLTGTANMEDCISTTQFLLNTTNDCPYSNCGLESYYQPTVEGSNFVGLDDLAAVCLFLEVPPNPVLSDILAKTEEFCSLTWSQLETLYPDVSTSDLDKYCFEGIFIYELLTYGYGFDPSSQQILLAETLYGIELSWALGAMTSQVANYNF